MDCWNRATSVLATTASHFLQEPGLLFHNLEGSMTTVGYEKIYWMEWFSAHGDSTAEVKHCYFFLHCFPESNQKDLTIIFIVWRSILILKVAWTNPSAIVFMEIWVRNLMSSLHASNSRTVQAGTFCDIAHEHYLSPMFSSYPKLTFYFFHLHYFFIH